MTFNDWMRETIERFRTERLTKALFDSLAELYSGISRQVYYQYSRRRGYPMRIGGYSSRFKIESIEDIKRARCAFGESQIMKFVLDGLAEDSVFWDIGSYHGHYAIHAVNTGADVIAFEPNSENRCRFHYNAVLNNRQDAVDIRSYALSDSTAIKSFGGGKNSTKKIGGHGRKILTRRGDELNPKPDVIKIDVEGHELEVLDGLTETLSQVQRVVVEMHSEDDIKDVQDYLEDAGLNLHEFNVNSRSETYIGAKRD